LKFDRKQFSDIGLVFQRNTIAKFLAGIVVGITIMGVLATSVLYLTNVRMEVNTSSNVLHFLLATLPLLPLAFMEELGFRAYPLQILKAKIGIRLAIIITSILFALYHIVNGWTIASSFYGPAVWGLVFGLASIYSKGIAMPTGIHYAANLTTSAFGTGNSSVSIWTVRPSTTATPKGIDWATVLPFFALLTFAIICIELYMRRKTTANSALAMED
jgi:membrane protease YdiL (CAAX protease family)